MAEQQRRHALDRQNGPTRRLNPGPAVEGIIAAYEADPDGIGGKLDPPLTSRVIDLLGQGRSDD